MKFGHFLTWLSVVTLFSLGINVALVNMPEPLSKLYLPGMQHEGPLLLSHSYPSPTLPVAPAEPLLKPSSD